MRRVSWLVLSALVVAALGVASARAAGEATTTSTTTTSTTTTTTTSTTTTTTATTSTTPSYAPLRFSSLPAGCVGAGAAALVLPSGRVIALGTPASDLGPSAYSGSVLAFSSSTVAGSGCSSVVMLSSVSLFGGAITAHSVKASAGKGRVTELAIDGSTVAASGGETMAVDGWGQLTLGATVGRVTAPLVLRLIQARDGLPAGTAVMVAFGASARTVAKPTHQRPTRGASGSAGGKSRRNKHGSRKPPPDFPTASKAFTLAGGLPKAARKNPVVSLARRYLGVRYQWGGATPATGFDCSGLVTYVFGKLGVSLPHFAASQYYSPDGVWVRPSRLEPGDLVFFTGSDGTRKSPGHVGIYVADGYIIDAPHTGAFVRIDSLNDPRLANEYVGAKRITTRLLAARHLFHASKPDGSTAGLFPYPAANGVALLNEPLELVAAETRVVRPSLLAHWKWAGVALGGGILLLLGGGLAIRRRRGLRLIPAWPFST